MLAAVAIFLILLLLILSVAVVALLYIGYLTYRVRDERSEQASSETKVLLRLTPGAVHAALRAILSPRRELPCPPEVLSYA